jgi:hypothetical protein
VPFYTSLPGQPGNTIHNPAGIANVPVPGVGQTVAVPYTGAAPNATMINELGQTIEANAVTSGLSVNGSSVAINNPFYGQLPPTAPSGTISQQDVREAIGSSYTVPPGGGNAVPVQAAPSGSSAVIPGASAGKPLPTTGGMNQRIAAANANKGRGAGNPSLYG